MTKNEHSFDEHLVEVAVWNTTLRATRVYPDVQRIPVDMDSKSSPATAGGTARLLAGTCQNLSEQIPSAPRRINERLDKGKSCSPIPRALQECLLCQNAAFSIGAQEHSPVPGPGASLFLVTPFCPFPLLPTFILTNRSTHSNRTSSDFPRKEFANEWGCAVNGASTYHVEAPKTAPPGNQKAQEWQPGHPHTIFEISRIQAMTTLEPTRRERATFGSFCFGKVTKKD